MSHNSNVSLCEIVEYLANNSLLRFLLVMRLVLAILGLALFAMLFKVQGTYLSFHSNARILLVAHHIWSMLNCFTMFGMYLFELIRYGQDYDDACSYLMTTTVSVSVRGPANFTSSGQIWALAAMAVERSWATSRYRTYESKNYTLGRVLVILECLLSAAYFWLIIAWLDWSELKASATVSSARTSAIFSNTLAALGGVEMFVILLFCGLWLINKHRRKRMNNAELTVKYQLEENIRAMRIIIPMVVTHFCCFMPSLVVGPVYMKTNPHLDPRDYTVFLELFNFAPFYSDILPIVLLWRHRKLRQNLRNASEINQTNVVEPMRADGRTPGQVRHFEVLRQMWILPNS